MAIKQYQSYTLTDNWFEERAPPLRGVMPDYGDRCFTTQASQDYPPVRREQITSRPEKLAKLTMSNSGALLMTRESSWPEAVKERESVATQPSFLSVLPYKPKGQNLSKDWTTNFRDGYGVADMRKQRSFEATMRASDAPWARGRPGPRQEMGKSTSGCSGEVYKVSDDPQIDTACQRSWLYYEDPMLIVKKDGPPPKPYIEPTSLPGLGEASEDVKYDPEFGYKRKAVITKFFTASELPAPGKRVFMDDEEAPKQYVPRQE